MAFVIRDVVVNLIVFFFPLFVCYFARVFSGRVQVQGNRGVDGTHKVSIQSSLSSAIRPD